MSVRTPFSYQGSKLTEINNLKPYILPNSAIVEPFIGTGIVSYYYGNNNCIGNDLNQDISLIWKYAKERNKEFLNLCIEYMQEENRTPEYYYDKREQYNLLYKNNIWTIERVALFYFLINACHAAMVRFGPNGFNTSFKLFLIAGRKFRVKEKIKLLCDISDKFTVIANMDALIFLKHIEKTITTYDCVYCDPPYTNSKSQYIESFNDNNLLELDDFLFYLNKKYDIYCLMNNYYNDEINYKGTVSLPYVKTRLAGTSIKKSSNIIITYGKPKLKINSLESFMYG